MARWGPHSPLAGYRFSVECLGAKVRPDWKSSVERPGMPRRSRETGLLLYIEKADNDFRNGLSRPMLSIWQPF
jgi:hypothetical protein